MARNRKDLGDLNPSRAEMYVNEPPWRWSSKKRTVESYYPRVGDELDRDLSDGEDPATYRDDESRLADYITPDTLEVYQGRARRKERAQSLLEKGREVGGAAIKTGGQAVVKGAEIALKGAKAAESGLTRYAAWVDKKNIEAAERDERDREEAVERRRRAVERQRSTMELQREQRQLDLEERRLQLELQREEMQMRREFGEPPAPQRVPPPYGGGYASPAPQRSLPSYGGGYASPAPQQDMFSPFGGPTYGFGVPEPGFENPRDIVMRGSGINLFGTPEPERRPPKKKTKQNSTPAKKKAAAPKKKRPPR